MDVAAITGDTPMSISDIPWSPRRSASLSLSVVATSLGEMRVQARNFLSDAGREEARDNASPANRQANVIAGDLGALSGLNLSGFGARFRESEREHHCPDDPMKRQNNAAKSDASPLDRSVNWNREKDLRGNWKMSEKRVFKQAAADCTTWSRVKSFIATSHAG
jgi:hypothetical protein